MPLSIDFGLDRFEDGVVTVTMTPALNISGETLQFTLRKRHQNVSGSTSGLIVKSAASGFNNVSGVNVTDGINGRFNVALFRTDLSGEWDPGNYAFTVERLTSGSQRTLVEGFRLMQ